MKQLTKNKLIELEKLVSSLGIDVTKSRFALNQKLEWMAFVDTALEGSQNKMINCYLLKGDEMIKTGFISYAIGKGFWSGRQVNFHKLEVDNEYRQNGIATYALSFLTEIANSNRVWTIDGNYYPDDWSAGMVYDKNGFVIEKEYYDTRIVKSVESSNLETIVNNTNEYNGIKIYNNHRELYIDKYKNKENEIGLTR